LTGVPFEVFQKCTGRVTAKQNKQPNVFILFTVSLNFYMGLSSGLVILDTKELFELIKFLHILVVKPFILKFELQFYLRASQPRFILLWQM
jgi:hypothetical protein